MVTALRAPLPDDDVLVALAASVEPVDEATWDAFVTEATGGGALAPDVVVRAVLPGHDARRARVAPPHRLRLRGRRGAARSAWPAASGPAPRATPGGGGGGVWTARGEDRSSDLSFVILATDRPEAVSVRVTTTQEVVEAPLVVGPDGTQRVAVVFVAPVDVPSCRPASRSTAGGRGWSPIAVQILDAAGAVVECPGF